MSLPHQLQPQGPSIPGMTEPVRRQNTNNSNPNKVLDQLDYDYDAGDDDDDLEHAFFKKYERRNWSLILFEQAGRWGIRINPVSFGVSVIVIFFFAVWCMRWPQEAQGDITSAQEWVTMTLTWIYMLTQQIWVIFLIVLYCSHLGGMKLGAPDDVPEFPTASWFMMMFSAGIGIGLFFFGVAEPVLHYEPCASKGIFAGVGTECLDANGNGGNRYSRLPDDERAQWAMNLTFFHWGVHAWVTYCIIGLLLGAVVYRKDLPMTMKSAFYPLIGDKVFGWMGDMLDVLSVATTLFGVCTSLGLGVQQLNAGFSRLNPAIETNFTTQSIIIWSITLLATVSVLTGVKVGIRRISEINFLMGQFLLMSALFQGNTWYLMNNFVQSCAFYVQWFVQLGSHSDTFQMGPIENLQDTDGTPVEVKSTAPDGLNSDRDWMNTWTIFYWGWWIAWAPFVGMFIAKISRGRTVRQIINGALTGPVIYSFFWFAIFGGTALRVERQAANLGIQCNVDDNDSIQYIRVTPSDTLGLPLDSPMVELEGRQFWRLSCRETTDMWFDVFANYPLHKFYWGLSIASLILYFVTSSDSGSLVIDCLTANGNPRPPVLQRVFWSVAEGAVAMGLLRAGGSTGLEALQAVSILAGAPYTIVICLMCAGLWKVLSEEYDRYYNVQRHVFDNWRTNLLDVLDYPTFRKDQAFKTAIAVVAPWYYAARGAAWADGVSEVYYRVMYAVLFNGWIVLLISNTGRPGLWAIAWVLFVAFVAHMAYERSNLRGLRNIEGNVLTDVLVSVVAYPLVAVQLHDEGEAGEEEDGQAAQHVF